MTLRKIFFILAAGLSDHLHGSGNALGRNIPHPFRRHDLPALGGADDRRPKMLGHIFLSDDQLDHGQFFLVIPHHSFIDNGRAAREAGKFEFLQRAAPEDGRALGRFCSLYRKVFQQ